MMKLLLTGFEPFQGFSVNPSAMVAEKLDGRHVGGYRVVAKILPVVFEAAGSLVEEWIKDFTPDAVLCLGLAAGRSKLTLERVAINCREGSDGSGRLWDGEPIEPEGPAAYFTTLPLRHISGYISGHGLPAAISNTAGTYVCNDLIYRVLHHLSTRSGPAFPAGFMHLPANHRLALEQAADPSWPDSDLVRGVSLAVEALGNVSKGEFF